MKGFVKGRFRNKNYCKKDLQRLSGIDSTDRIFFCFVLCSLYLVDHQFNQLGGVGFRMNARRSGGHEFDFSSKHFIPFSG